MNHTTSAFRRRVVYVTSCGAQFPVRYDAGETISSCIRAQLADGRLTDAVWMPSLTTDW